MRFTPKRVHIRQRGVERGLSTAGLHAKRAKGFANYPEPLPGESQSGHLPAHPAPALGVTTSTPGGRQHEPQIRSQLGFGSKASSAIYGCVGPGTCVAALSLGVLMSSGNKQQHFLPRVK